MYEPWKEQETEGERFKAAMAGWHQDYKYNGKEYKESGGQAQAIAGKEVKDVRVERIWVERKEGP